MRLTDLQIKKLRAPDRGQKTYFDDGLRGFGVRVSQGGSKSFVVMFGSSSLCVTGSRLEPCLLPACMRVLSKLSPGPGAKVLGMRQDASGSYVVSAVAPENAICPHCGSPSRHRHGRYSRRLQDLPVQGKLVTVEIFLSRWKCKSLNCNRKTFADRVPRVAQSYARRTSRLSEIVELIGHSMGGRPGEYVMRRLGMQVSDDTILRQLKLNSANTAPRADIRVVGIDDWSWRRSSRYGTIMVDLERHEVVDVLNDRKAETAAKWLKDRPSIEVVSRDRCGLYAQAAREGAPQAKEVADRFHLVQNLRAAIKEQMSLLGQGNIRPILSKEALACNAAQHRRARLAHRA